MIYSTTDVTDWLGTISTRVMQIITAQEYLTLLSTVDGTVRSVTKHGETTGTNHSGFTSCYACEFPPTIRWQVFITCISDLIWRLMTSNANDNSSSRYFNKVPKYIVQQLQVNISVDILKIQDNI